MAVAGNTSIGDLFGNTNYYSNPRLCLENSHFVLNFGACIPYYHNIPMLTKKILVIAHYPVTVTLPIPDGLGTMNHTYAYEMQHVYSQHMDSYHGMCIQLLKKLCYDDTN